MINAASVRLSGDPEALVEVADNVPDEIDVAVDTGDPDLLTDRQRQVVETAVEMGFYDIPRQATTADIASELDAASSTVNELLRRAEDRIIKSAVGGDVDD